MTWYILATLALDLTPEPGRIAPLEVPYQDVGGPLHLDQEMKTQDKGKGKGKKGWE